MALGFCLMAGLALASRADSGPMWGHNDIEVSLDDVVFYLEKHVHESARLSALDRPNAIRQILENIYVLRRATEEAQAADLLSQARLDWAARDAQERIGTQQWVDHIAETVFANMDWNALAEEHYLAHPERYAAGEQVDVDHILISGDDRSFDELTVRVREIGERIAAGEDFEALAREVSEDPSVERNAGHLGFISRGTTHPAFEKAAFALTEPGEISEPILTSFGVHFIRYNGRRMGGAKSFEQVAPLIIKDLKKEQTAKARERAFTPFKQELAGGPLAEVDEAAIRELIIPLISNAQDDS